VRVYLAGPEVFLPNAREVGERKKSLCAQAGLIGLYPLDNDFGATDGERLDQAIYRANRRMIEQADAGIFNLTPFRGCSADVGTVFELGMMAGLGKPVFGYSSVAADLRARVAGAKRHPDGIWRDAHGYLVEDFGNADNLMIDASLKEGGNAFLRVAGSGRIDDLEAFAACVSRAASLLGAQAQPATCDR
jgi:nucleoside 2-deoxyribosyltransferase